jgi:hypothetical protein
MEGRNHAARTNGLAESQGFGCGQGNLSLHGDDLNTDSRGYVAMI